MRFDPHDLIYRLRHTLFFSFFFAWVVGASIFFRVRGRHVDSENAELAGKPNAELAGKPNAELAGTPNAELAGIPNWRNDIVKKGGMP